jgi:tRNA-specific 2-thiouridylase
VAAKGDSQEICFVPNGDYAAFLRAYLEESGVPKKRTRGSIVTSDGRTLGEHEGVHNFTVGQRRGLGVATGEPLYVIATDALRQRVIVGGNDDLLRARFFAKGVNWISIAALAEPMRAQVKIRNKHVAAPATLHATGDAARVEVVFDQPQRAVTPGQGAVFYDGELVLGGGWIE